MNETQQLVKLERQAFIQSIFNGSLNSVIHRDRINRVGERESIGEDKNVLVFVRVIRDMNVRPSMFLFFQNAIVCLCLLVYVVRVI